MTVIRPCRPDDLERMFQIINDAAQAYRGIIPADRWKDPYMPVEELENEIAHGVRFSGIEVDGVLVGIMGVQPVKDVTLIRHAYVAQSHRNKGLGGVLLEHLLQQTTGPIPPGGDLGCGNLGDPLLREPRVPAGEPGRKGPALKDVLVHLGAAGGNFRGPG